jgi:hypothetical protein
MENVQRLTLWKGVGSSDPKWETSSIEDEDIVWSIWRHIAAGNAAEIG